MIFHAHANKTHFHKKGCALSLILEVRVFGTWKWPIPAVQSPLPPPHPGLDSKFLWGWGLSSSAGID